MFGGNISILCFGEVFPVAPCKWALHIPGPISYHRKSLSYHRIGHLWRDNFMLQELTTNMRHKDHLAFSEMCARFRVDQQTKAAIAALTCRTLPHVDPDVEPFSLQCSSVQNTTFLAFNNCKLFNRFQPHTLSSARLLLFPVSVTMTSQHISSQRMIEAAQDWLQNYI